MLTLIILFALCFAFIAWPVVLGMELLKRRRARRRLETRIQAARREQV